MVMMSSYHTSYRILRMTSYHTSYDFVSYFVYHIKNTHI